MGHTSGLQTSRLQTGGIYIYTQVGYRQVGHISGLQTGGIYKWARDK